MDQYKLPSFLPISKEEMRQLWVENPTGKTRRMLLEIERWRKVFGEIDQLYLTIHQSWRNEFGGDLMALHLLKQVMYNERQRIPK